MEKRVAHYHLSEVQALLAEGKVRATTTALAGAAALEIDFQGMKAVVAGLTALAFYKSMTAYNDHRTWHDVYHAAVGDDEIYIELTIIDGVLIVSFKEL
jgi:motility quorum-sensing regulator/GCU-specific mRNA interferase toxin